MSYREQFIAAWVTQQQRAFHQSTRGIMPPEDRRILKLEAESEMRKIEREAAARALYDLARDSEALEGAARDGMNSRGGPYPWNAAKGVRDLLHARAAEYRKAVQS